MENPFSTTQFDYDLVLLIKEDKLHFIEMPIVNNTPCTDIEVRFPAAWTSTEVVKALAKLIAEINSNNN